MANLVDRLAAPNIMRSTFDAATFARSSLDPLPPDIRHGMIGMGIIGLFSTLSTISLIIFITWRMIAWRKYYDAPIATNQIFVLIYNLLLADFQQALSFLIAFHWVSENRLVGPNNACFAQGWLIQIGDVSSGLWVLSIGVHTFVNLVLQKRVSGRIFIAWVAGLWLFCFILTAVGPIVYKRAFFVPAGAWCWISDEHESARLYLHYVWIFLAQVGSLFIYTIVFFVLRKRLADVVRHQNSAGIHSSNNADDLAKASATTTTVIATQMNDPFLVSRQRIARNARYMVAYPIIYVLLTLPLAAGRVSAMKGNKPSLIFFVVAGTMMASCGFIDVILYISTRKALVRSNVGVKSAGGMENRLTRVQTGGPSSSTASDAIRMQALDVPRGMGGRTSKLPRGTIVVSKSVTMSEDSGASSIGIERSDSQASLVLKQEGSAKSWRT